MTQTRKPNPSRRGESTARPKAQGPAGPATFADLLKPLVPPPARPMAQAILASAPLAHLAYAAELKAKNDALALFWAQHKLPGQPEPLVGSPRPRGYRTTSKRKTVLRGANLFLYFSDKATRSTKAAFVPSPLEPPEHGAIYRFLQQKLSEPPFRLAAAHMNYIIIRGSYRERAVIFNVDLLNGPIVRKLKLLAEHLQSLPEPVAAAFVYLDPTHSDYYLESRRPSETLHFKKLFGPDQLLVAFGSCRYRFPPTSFSQINESMVETMLAKATEMLAPGPEASLLDFYCGYGLFSHFLAPDYRQVLAVDAEGPSIRAATANSRLNPGSANTRFISRRITEDVIEGALPAPRGPEAVILDPPRQGPQEGVIEAICRREPEKVLHIFCGVDQIPPSLAAWEENGYRVRRVVPLDMFPGSANLEVLILLTPEEVSP